MQYKIIFSPTQEGLEKQITEMINLIQLVGGVAVVAGSGYYQAVLVNDENQ